MSTKKNTPTNAVRILAKTGTHFTLHEYEVADGLIDALSIASKCNLDKEIVYKTLVVRTQSQEICVFVIPATCELDLKKAAACVGAKNVALVHVSELLPLTGYIRGGCSPIGMKHSYPTFFEVQALSHPTISISAGRKGLCIEAPPADLAAVAGADFADIVLNAHQNATSSTSAP